MAQFHIMPKDLQVALVQKNLLWEDKDANLLQFETVLQQITPSTDLVILPEMFSTGFSMNAEALAEDMDGPTVQWLRNMARKYQFVLTGSIIIEVNKRYYNRLVWMRPNGQYSIYDKRHLFTFSGEHLTYTAGQEHLLVEINGWKVMPLICYDLRFPVWSRNKTDYDLLIYVANFPEKRRDAWKSLLIARAIENQAYTVGVNRVGVDGNNHSYSGDSMIIDYNGQTLSSAAYIENIQYATLSYADQQVFRTKFAFLNDRDEFEIMRT